MTLINSRFGELNISDVKLISFAHGIIGINDNHDYYLVNWPSEEFKEFKILQSIDDQNLSFMTLPLDMNLNPNFIEQEDLKKCSSLFNVEINDITILFITSFEQHGSEMKFFINKRAPIVINNNKNTAIQHVFNHDKYLIKHPIN